MSTDVGTQKLHGDQEPDNSDSLSDENPCQKTKKRAGASTIFNSAHCQPHSGVEAAGDSEDHGMDDSMSEDDDRSGDSGLFDCAKADALYT